jgi:putative oxidoreductase
LYRQSALVERPGSRSSLSGPDNPYSWSHANSRLHAASSRDRTARAALLLGRAIFGGYFLYSGVSHFQNQAMMSGYAASKGVRAPKAAVIGSGALVALGGLSLLLGVKPRLGAGMIGAFLLGVTPSIHDFWKQDDPQAKMNEQVHFLKNMALIGGASLAAAVPEPWPLSVGN